MSGAGDHLPGPPVDAELPCGAVRPCESCLAAGGCLESAPVPVAVVLESAPQPVRMVIVTRPQDWAEPARRVLIERGAWRRHDRA